MLIQYGDVLRAITGILALVLLLVIFTTSTLQGEKPSDEILSVLIPLAAAYLGSDILSAKKSIDNGKKE